MARWPVTHFTRLLLLLVAAAALAIAAAIGCPSNPQDLTAPTAPGELAPPAQPPVLVGAGDIADCTDAAHETASLLDAIP